MPISWPLTAAESHLPRFFFAFVMVRVVTVEISTLKRLCQDYLKSLKSIYSAYENALP
jgi:hypothetical protein